ncbi:hypothetical protein M0R45_004732 [Rubus argutus]|uniref:Thioredoxin-like protein n=1 Tax=Rubus argutus TaxID=59490 RepID=A0AAW1YKN8_RUBAR
MALISTQTLTLKSPPTFPLPSHPSSQCPSLSPPKPHPSPSSTPQNQHHAIGEVLGDVGIFTATGDSVQFKDLWDQNEGIVVVALLRHFGCVCCWELASALKESKLDLTQLV